MTKNNNSVLTDSRRNEAKTLINQCFVGKTIKIDGSIYYRHAWCFQNLLTGQCFTTEQLLDIIG